jgi:hypothetical protein
MAKDVLKRGKSVFSNRILILCFISIFISCDNPSSQIESFRTKLDDTEANLEVLTGENLDELKLGFEELDKDFTENRGNYNQDQIKELNELKGRYAALLIKKGVIDSQNGLIDLEGQLKGFIEEIKTDSTNKKK